MNKQIVVLDPEVCPVCGCTMLDPAGDGIYWTGQDEIEEDMMCTECGCEFTCVFKTQCKEIRINDKSQV